MLLMELFHPSTFEIKTNENMPDLGLTLQGHSKSKETGSGKWKLIYDFLTIFNSNHKLTG